MIEIGPNLLQLLGGVLAGAVFISALWLVLR